MTRWFDVDDTAWVNGIARSLAKLVAEERDKTEALGDRVANMAEQNSGGKFTVTAAPSRTAGRDPIGGRYAVIVTVKRKRDTPKGRYYVDPGPAAAWWYEFGTSRQPPRPFLRPALARGASEGL